MSVSRNRSDLNAADARIAEQRPAAETVFGEQTLWQGDVQSVPQPVSVGEVEEACASAIVFQVMAAGHAGQHEGIYLKLGQTQAGRLLAILFAYRGTRNAWILSARSMAPKERCYYRQQTDGRQNYSQPAFDQPAYGQ